MRIILSCSRLRILKIRNSQTIDLDLLINCKELKSRSLVDFRNLNFITEYLLTIIIYFNEQISRYIYVYSTINISI